MNIGHLKVISCNEKENFPPSIFGEHTKEGSIHSANRYLFKQESELNSFLPPSRKEIRARRTSSHQRQRSIYFPAETNFDSMLISLKNRESPSLSHNLSDADSVVYLGPGDISSLNNTFGQELEKKSELQLSTVETASGSIVSIEKTSVIEPSKNLPILGESSVTYFCRFCKKDVHTHLDLSAKYKNSVFEFVSKVVACCNLPKWIADNRVHKCSVCTLVLGKCRS